MDELLYLRKRYGEVFVTELPNGQIVPWKPLSTGDFLHYNKLLSLNKYPSAYIENEIFSKCVLDKPLIDSIDILKAGTVQVVVTGILAFSGPQDPNELNYMLDLHRMEVQDAMHNLVGMICQAFPAYKPEEVYAMDYTTFMERAALAEHRLIESGILAEPIKFVSIEGEEEAKIEEKPKKNLLDEYFAQQGIKVPESKKKEREEIRKQIVPDYIPPTPPPTTERTIISKSDMIETESYMTGHEQDIVNKTKAADETAQFYKDYIDQYKKGKEIRILTPEERKAAAEERMKESKKKLTEMRRQAAEAAREELPKLLQVREEARKRKERKAAKRRK